MHTDIWRLKFIDKMLAEMAKMFHPVLPEDHFFGNNRRAAIAFSNVKSCPQVQKIPIDVSENWRQGIDF